MGEIGFEKKIVQKDTFFLLMFLLFILFSFLFFPPPFQPRVFYIKLSTTAVYGVVNGFSPSGTVYIRLKREKKNMYI